MAQRSREQMYAATGMTDAQREHVIYLLRRRGHSYAKIARGRGQCRTVQASLRRTGRRLSPGAESADDWDADLR